MGAVELRSGRYSPCSACCPQANDFGLVLLLYRGRFLSIFHILVTEVPRLLCKWHLGTTHGLFRGYSFFSSFDAFIHSGTWRGRASQGPIERARVLKLTVYSVRRGYSVLVHRTKAMTMDRSGGREAEAGWEAGWAGLGSMPNCVFCCELQSAVGSRIHFPVKSAVVGTALTTRRQGSGVLQAHCCSIGWICWHPCTLEPASDYYWVALGCPAVGNGALLGQSQVQLQGPRACRRYLLVCTVCSHRRQVPALACP